MTPYLLSRNPFIRLLQVSKRLARGRGRFGYYWRRMMDGKRDIKIFHVSEKLDVSVILPVFNGATLLEAQLSFLKTYFSEVIVGIDSKTTDNSLLIAESMADKVMVIENHRFFAEPMIYELAQMASNDLVLRIDIDEVIGASMLMYIANTLNDCGFNKKFIIGFPRRWVRGGELNKLEYVDDARFGLDYQYRLFWKDKVAFVPWIHTAGVFTEESRVYEAPSWATLYHFEYLLETKNSRNKKLTKYDEEKMGAGSKNRKKYELENYSVHRLDDEHMYNMATKILY